MTEQDPGEGFFDHLDDPGAPVPGGHALDTVMLRGRHLRARRRAAFATSMAAAATAAVIGGLGISHALNADGSGDTIVPPANSQTPSSSVTPSKSPGHHHGGGGQVLTPGAGATQ